MAIILLACGPCMVIVNCWDRFCSLGRAPHTKKTLPDFCEWCRVTQHPRVFRRLTGCQRTPRFWGVTYTLMIIYIQTHVSFVGNEFSGSHRMLRTPSNTFWTFTVGVSEPVRIFHLIENPALLVITRHKFSFTISYNCATLLDFI